MITTSTTDVTNDSSNASHEQHKSSLLALPGDIVLEIFAHLSKQDCLRCMAVCRDWYNNVPEYTRNVWKELRLSNKTLSNHGMIERFLGNHVKKLVIEPRRQYYKERVEEIELHSLLQKAVSWGCTEVESIGKTVSQRY
ncbi:hypothetical protein BJV82DRAFT_584031 [Fennellomyces sp. T-0311]|nr:hypothetical protein BJV82DRAFT_584031 [Fennellomyces sp. T-0311]